MGPIPSRFIWQSSSFLIVYSLQNVELCLTQIFKEFGIISQNWMHFPVISFADEYPVIWDVGLNIDCLASEMSICFKPIVRKDCLSRDWEIELRNSCPVLLVSIHAQFISPLVWYSARALSWSLCFKMEFRVWTLLFSFWYVLQWWNLLYFRRRNSSSSWEVTWHPVSGKSLFDQHGLGDPIKCLLKSDIRMSHWTKKSRSTCPVGLRVKVKRRF